jgi:nucleoside-diphosphate-sugar epimerase
VASVALITGASGLIGQHVLHQWDIEGIRPQAVNHQSHDLLTRGVPTDLVAHLSPSIVVHLAWAASGDPGYRTSLDNDRWVLASMELESACRAAGTWFVGTGTPLDLESEATDAYSSAKRDLWRLLQPAVDSGEITWLRPYYVVDPDRRRPALVGQAFAARDSGGSLVLRTPDSQHDFIHASDVGRAVVMALRSRLLGEISIGSGQLRRVCDLVAALGVSWSPDPSHPASAPPTQHHEAADIRRLLDLGWSPIRTKEMFNGE